MPRLLARLTLALIVTGFLLSSNRTYAVPSGGALSGERYRIIVSSDIGGSDPDDFQSMVHLLIYADLFDIEGLISSPPNEGRKEHILETLQAYEADYPRLRTHSASYPTPDALRALTKQGAIDAAPSQGFTTSTEGSRHIIEQAKRDDPRPLYILVWGSITDVAQALHDDPSIKSKIRVYSIASWNTSRDPHARAYIAREHSDLWWIEAETTFRGMYVGGNQAGDLANRSFISNHVRNHGALGAFLVSKKSDIKMGDTPSLLYLLQGDPDDPTKHHWGGMFAKGSLGPNYWTDRTDYVEGDYPGAQTVNMWRELYLRDWQRRMDRTLSSAPSNLRPSVWLPLTRK